MLALLGSLILDNIVILLSGNQCDFGVIVMATANMQRNRETSALRADHQPPPPTAEYAVVDVVLRTI
jgi:hypothetical protein